MRAQYSPSLGGCAFAIPLFLWALSACTAGSAATSLDDGSRSVRGTADGGAASEERDGAYGNAEADAEARDAIASETDPTTSYRPHVITFDDLQDGVTVTNQYKQWVSFSSIQGCNLETTGDGDFGQSDPNFVMTYNSCDQGDTADVTFRFTKPVRRVRFNAIGINKKKAFATMVVTRGDGSVENIAAVGIGKPMKPLPIAIPDTQPVLSLAFTNIDDSDGIGFDDLAFDFPE